MPYFLNNKDNIIHHLLIAHLNLLNMKNYSKLFLIIITPLSSKDRKVCRNYLNSLR